MLRILSKSRTTWLLLLLLIMVLFYWKILLTRQFSILTDFEGANQTYSWFHFWVATLRQGVAPLWDPYVFSGRSFSGEMQTGAFYPLNLFLALLPFNRYGQLSPQTYQWFFVLTHFLAACFMFALIHELGLGRLAALIAAVCFSLGGFLVRAGWPHILGSGIWLPLIFLFLVRAMKAETLRQAALRASACGLSLGIAILAGGLHMVIMQALVIVTAVVFYAWQSNGQPSGMPPRVKPWVWAAVVITATASVAFAAGAIQLLPSIEYSRRAFRFAGAMLPATTKIPYAYLNDYALPHSVFTLILFSAFGGKVSSGEYWNPYVGVFPLLLAVIGVSKNWSQPSVRYLAGLAAGAFVFSLGPFSFLHGVLYAVVPLLWMAREAARFLYLVSFALAVLAAYGAETLLAKGTGTVSWNGLVRALQWVAIACAIALSVPAVFERPEIRPWISLSMLFIFASYGLFLYVTHGHYGWSARFVAMALILLDLNAFDWSPQNKIHVTQNGTDQLERLLSCRGAAAFLKSQAGLARVQVVTDFPPNIGDAFGIQTINGTGVTLPINYKRFVDGAPHATDMLNVRYFMKPAASSDPGPVYQDTAWKVYENPQAYPRAWLVHEAVVEMVATKLWHQLNEVDPHRVAVVGAPLDAALAPVASGAREDVGFEWYEANEMLLRVRTEGRALLVLSEVFYPGWQATVNDRPARIYEVDGALRGIVVNGGENRVGLRYAPGSVFAGALLTLLAFAWTLAAFFLDWRKYGWTVASGLNMLFRRNVLAVAGPRPREPYGVALAKFGGAVVDDVERKTATSDAKKEKEGFSPYHLTAVWCCVLFFLVGCAFIPLAGFQTDEVMFASGIHDPGSIPYSVKAFDKKLPLMLMPYMGALKTWLYAPILAVCRPSAYSVRIPVLLVGSITIWLLFLFMRRTVGDWAAVIGTALLATDPNFLLTTCFDWGPVALQHFFLVAGVLLLLTGGRVQSPSRLALAFFLFGLGIWDKVVFAWPLIALVVAFTIVFPRSAASAFNRRRVTLAARWFCLGCLPLLIYNIARPLSTLCTKVWVPGSLLSQFRFLRLTFEGNLLFGWLTFMDAGPHPVMAHGMLRDACAWLSTAFRHSQHTLLWPAFLTALLITPILWFTQRRALPESAALPAHKCLLVAIIAMILFWALMVYPYNGAGGLQHTILLWPLPQFIIGTAFAGISCRFRRLAALAVNMVVAVLLLVNLLVINEYYEELATKGPAVQWTDASYPLADTLDRLTPRHVVLTDWGLLNTIRLLDRGKLDLVDLSSLLNNRRPFSAGDETILRYWLSQAGTIFVGHTAGDEILPGVNANLAALTRDTKYEKELLDVAYDRNGRAILEVFGFRRSSLRN